MTARAICVVIGAGPAPTAAEALRAAVGLTLRGDQVTVVADERADLGTAAAQRAVATLAMFGHRRRPWAELDLALDADVIEVWGGATAAPVTPVMPVTPVRSVRPAAPVRDRPLLHLLRPGHQAPTASAGDLVLHLDEHDDDALLEHILAATAVVVW
jgi:hypothetical protein